MEISTRKGVYKTYDNKTGSDNYMPPGVISVLQAPDSSMLNPTRYKLLVISADLDGSRPNSTVPLIPHSIQFL